MARRSLKADFQRWLRDQDESWQQREHALQQNYERMLGHQIADQPSHDTRSPSPPSQVKQEAGTPPDHRPASLTPTNRARHMLASPPRKEEEAAAVLALTSLGGAPRVSRFGWGSGGGGGGAGGGAGGEAGSGDGGDGRRSVGGGGYDEPPQPRPVPRLRRVPRTFFAQMDDRGDYHSYNRHTGSDDERRREVDEKRERADVDGRRDEEGRHRNSFNERHEQQHQHERHQHEQQHQPNTFNDRAGVKSEPELHDDHRRHHEPEHHDVHGYGESSTPHHHHQRYDRVDHYKRAEHDRRVGPPPLRRHDVWHEEYDPRYPGYDHRAADQHNDQPPHHDDELHPRAQAPSQPQTQPQAQRRPLSHAQLLHENLLHTLLSSATSEPFPERRDRRLNIDRVVPARGGRVLDIGCGKGLWVADVAAAFPECDVFGLDVEKVWKLPAPRNCEFHVADLDSLTVPRATGSGVEAVDVPEDTFDVVHLRFMHAKVHDFPQLVKHAWSLLRAGGILLLLDSAFLPAVPTPHSPQSHAVPPGVEAYNAVLNRALANAGLTQFKPESGALLDTLEAVSTGFEVDYDLPLTPAHRAALEAGLLASRVYLERLGLTLHQVRRLEDGYLADLGEGMIVRYTALGVRKCRPGEETKDVWGPRVQDMLRRERQCELQREAVERLRQQVAARNRGGSIAALLN